MSVLTRYLNRIYFKSIAGTLIVILAFALLFDLLDVSDDLLSGDDNVLKAFASYIVLRTPSLLSEVLPIATLLAGLFSASALLRSSEMVVVWASGISIFRVMLRLMPVALIVMTVKFINDDWLVPGSIEGLRQWGVGQFKNERLGVGDDFVWFRQDNRIYRLPLFGERRGLAAFDLDENGNLTSRLDVGQAALDDKFWRFEQVVEQTGSIRREVASLNVAAPIDPAKLDILYRPPQELSLRQLMDVVWSDGYGAITTERHRTWLYQRLIGAAVPILMGWLAFSLARQFDRRQGAGMLFMKGIGIGFSFIIVNGVAVALGESGFLSPAIASFGPAMVLAVIVFWGPWRLHRQGGSLA